jgi:hypothetical protein
MARGLRRRGRPNLAGRVEGASLAMVEQSGFRESHNSLTGARYRARDFGWSARLLDMMAARLEDDALDQPLTEPPRMPRTK